MLVYRFSFDDSNLTILGENVEINHGLLDIVTKNDATKKVLPYVLKTIGQKDLQEKVSHYFIKELIG